jgi:hypothetical protein
VADKKGPWTAKVMSAAVVLVVTAVAGRLAWELLEPLLPYLLLLLGLILVYTVVLGRFR